MTPAILARAARVQPAALADYVLAAGFVEVDSPSDSPFRLLKRGPSSVAVLTSHVGDDGYAEAVHGAVLLLASATGTPVTTIYDALAPTDPLDDAREAAAVALDALEAATGARDRVALVRVLLEDPKLVGDEVVAEVLAKLIEARPAALELVMVSSPGELGGHDLHSFARDFEAYTRPDASGGWTIESFLTGKLNAWDRANYPTEAEAIAALEALAPCPAAIVRGGS